MPDGWLTNRYNYRVVRLWGEDPEPYLTAGVNLVPLAPLAKVAEVASRLGRADGRADQRRVAPRAAKLWTAAYLLMGLCYSEESGLTVAGRGARHAGIDDISGDLEGRPQRRSDRRSQEGLMEGRVREHSGYLLRQGTRAFGKPGRRDTWPDRGDS